MLKPIEALYAFVLSTAPTHPTAGVNPDVDPMDWLRRHSAALEYALTHPAELGKSLIQAAPPATPFRRLHFDRGLVSAVYAHGNGAARIVTGKVPQAGTSGAAVHQTQVWNPTIDGWIKISDYPQTDEGLREAKKSANGLSGDALQPIATRNKWAFIDAAEGLEQAFDTRSKFAEFWYDIKATSWHPDEGNPNPWESLALLAEVVFDEHSEGVKNWREDFRDRQWIEVSLQRLQKTWGEPTPTVGIAHESTNSITLKPLEALAQHAAMTGQSLSWFELRKEALEHALLHPFEDLVNPRGSMFAHGSTATRTYYDPSDGHLIAPAVEYWDHENMVWTRCPDYHPDLNNSINPQTFATIASGPTPRASELLERWSGIDKAENEADFFDSRAKFAAFWYDMQVAKWGLNGNPHGHLALVADTLFKHAGRINEKLDATTQSKIQDTMSNLQLAWREIRLTPETARVAMRVCAMKDILELGRHEEHGAAVVVAKGTEGTVIHVRDDGRSLHVQWDKTKNSDYIGKLSRQPINTHDAALVSTCFHTGPRYLVSVRYTKGAIDAPNASRIFGEDIEHVWMTGEKMAETAREFGIDRASHPSPADAEHIWWVASVPRRDATHETCFQLDIHEVTADTRHGVREPTTEDFQRIADVIGVPFSEPMRTLDGNVPIYGYYVTLNEHEAYIAEVRNECGEKVFEVRAGDSVSDGDASDFDQIDMGEGEYLAPLESYLRTLDLIPANARLLAQAEFEAVLERRTVPAHAQDLGA
jgi:hypothetical protein